MDNTYLDAIHLWLQHNTVWIGPAIALVAFLESLVVVGIALPGVAILFALAAIAGAASLSVFPLLLWAFLGAIIGDGVSYLLGYYYREQVQNWWPFNHHPQWLANGEVFFRRYGILSVVIGRFVGPVRPVIPVVAGMMGMLPGYFFTVNFLSAMAWAPAYLLPGYFTGAALQWHDKVPDQLLMGLLVILFIAIMFPPLLIVVHRRFKPLLIWYPVMVFVLLTLFIMVNAIGYSDLLSQRVQQWLDSMQLNWLQEVMYRVAQVGSIPVLQALFVGCLIWLYRSNRLWNMICLLGGGVAMNASAWLIHCLTENGRPEWMVRLFPYGLPSGHMTATAFVLFSCAAILGNRRPFKVQWFWSGIAFGLIMMEAFARMILQPRGLNELLTGVGLGLFWALVVVWAAKRDQCPE